MASHGDDHLGFLEISTQPAVIPLRASLTVVVVGVNQIDQRLGVSSVEVGQVCAGIHQQRLGIEGIALESAEHISILVLHFNAVRFDVVKP